MAFGNTILSWMGKSDPRQALLAQAMGGAGGTPAAGDHTSAGAGGAGGAAAPVDPVYTSPPELSQLYKDILAFDRRSQNIDRGIGMIAASFAQPQNKNAILASTLPNIGGGSGGPGSNDPLSFLSNIMKFQQGQQASAMAAETRKGIPDIAKRYGIDADTALYLYDEGELDAVIKEAEKPNKQIVQQEDGTHTIVDLNTGELSPSFGVPKKREVELVVDPYSGAKVPVYKDTKEPVGGDTTAGFKGPENYGATEKKKLYLEAMDGKKEGDDGWVPFGQWLMDYAERGSTKINLGPNGVDYGDPPKDMAWARNEDGSVKLDDRGIPVAEYITNSPTDVERKAEEAKASDRESTEKLNAGVVNQDIDRVFAKMEEWKDSWVPMTGMAGKAASFVYGTPQYDVAELLGGIKANIGLNKLQEIRDNSPTGGALGPVSDFENKLLQATYGSLEQAQTRDQFLRNLYRVQRIFEGVINEEFYDPETGIGDTRAIEAALAEADRKYNETSDNERTIDDLLELYKD